MNQKIRIFLLIVIILIFNDLKAQDIQLEGKVESIDSDNKRIPLPFANVYWFGGNKGTTTDENGKFSLQKPSVENQYLIASYVSFVNDTMLVPINLKQIYFTLKSISTLDEIIIISTLLK